MAAVNKTSIDDESARRLEVGLRSVDRARHTHTRTHVGY